MFQFTLPVFLVNSKKEKRQTAGGRVSDKLAERGRDVVNSPGGMGSPTEEVGMWRVSPTSRLLHPEVSARLHALSLDE